MANQPVGDSHAVPDDATSDAPNDAPSDEGDDAVDDTAAPGSYPKATKRLTRVSPKNRVRLLARAVYLRVAREEAWQIQRDRTESLGLRAAVAGLETEIAELTARTGSRTTELGGAAHPRLADFYAVCDEELGAGATDGNAAAEALLVSIGEQPDSLTPWWDVGRDQPLDHLAALDSGSLGAATVRHVLELAAVEPALELLTSLRRALRAGGVLAIVTIDPTHPDAVARAARQPLTVRLWHPDLVAVLAGHCGFVDGGILPDRINGSDYVFTARAVGEPVRIALVVPDPVPYVFGGAQRVWRGLADHLRDHTTHHADIVALPSPELGLISLVDTYEDFARLDVSNYDLVITSKYPAWMIEHPRHVVYMFHTLRGLYDTYPRRLPPRVEHPDGVAAPLLTLLRRVPDQRIVPDVIGRFRDLVAARGPDDPTFAVPGPFSRELIHYLDRAAMAPEHVSRYSAISHTVARRRDYFPAGVTVDVAHPPSALRGLRSGRSDYFFTASRLDAPKRIDFIVEAMAHLSFDIPLKIAGTGPAMGDLQKLAAGDSRIEFLGHVTDDELVDLYADALAVPFLPLDEDLGLVTLEAMLCGKPVITCFDAGGPTEFVREGITGLLPDPAPEWIGRAYETLAADPEAARVMGANARRLAERVTWDHVVDTVLAEPAELPLAHARSAKPKLVVTSTFPVHPPFGGGQLRCHHLYGALTGDFDVEIVSLAPPDVGASRTTYAPGFVETVIPKSPEHQAQEDVIGAKIGFAVTDVVADLLADQSPAYLEALATAVDGAEVGLLAHPFLVATLRGIAPALPFVYDAHNAEFALKDTVMPANPSGRELVELVHRTERIATKDSIFVSVCSDDDRDHLASAYGPFDSVMIPNGVDTVGTRFTPLGQRLRRSSHWRQEMAHLQGIPPGSSSCALFIGSWHPPNVDALHTILELAMQLPDVAFLVAGSVCSEDVGPASELPANVAMLGMISDHTKQTLLSMADVALNPMTRGAGTNLKILEYFAAGVPTVSTDVGVRGLNVEHGRHLAIAPAEAFSEAITQVRSERARVVEMTAAARAMVEAEYEWQILGRRFADAIATRVGLRV